MSVAIGSDRSRQQARSRFARANVLIVERPPYTLDGLGVKPLDGKECDAFDRREGRVNDG
jgi:hypothetical protein